MAYCAKCGEKNEDDAKFCSKCGASLTGSKKDYEKEWEDRCEEDCAGGKRGGPPVFWGIIVILVGLWILFVVGFCPACRNSNHRYWYSNYCSKKIVSIHFTSFTAAFTDPCMLPV
jgi:uncharacterized membrane protein YvbJ